MDKRKLAIDRRFWEGEEVYRIMDDFKLPDEEELKDVCRYFRRFVKSVPKSAVGDWLHGRCSLNYERVCMILRDIENGCDKYIPDNLPILPPIDLIMHDLYILGDVGFSYSSTEFISKEILGGSRAVINVCRGGASSYLTYTKVRKICDYLLEKLENTLDFVENGHFDYILVPDI